MKDTVIKIAQEAGKILMKYFQSSIDVGYKNEDQFDPVTIADQTADQRIRDRLSALFPQDLILSEENDAIPTDYSKRIWMVDPLDGTNAFVKGIDSFSVLIGLWEADDILFGLVYAPARKKMYVAEKGKGAFEYSSDGSVRRLHVSRTERLEDARLITRNPSDDKRPFDALIERLPVAHVIEDSATKVARVAAGEAEAHINSNFRACKWDTLAPQLILEEAGGLMTDVHGAPLDYKQPGLKWENSYIAANNNTMLQQIIERMNPR